MKVDTQNELEKLYHKLELLKRIQERDVRKQYIHEHYTPAEPNEHLKQLQETVTKRKQEIQDLQKQIEELKTS